MTPLSARKELPEDVHALMREMGAQAYRLSLSWSRIMPEGTGRVNEQGLAFYDRLVDSLLEAGITPWMISADEFSSSVASERERWRKLIVEKKIFGD